MHRVFEAPLYYQDGKPYVKSDELTKNDIAKIRRVIIEEQMKTMFLKK